MKYQPSILVIDDETFICESCNRIFSQAGYKVDTYINSDYGLRQALAYDYDAIVLDLNLGKTDGMDLLRNFRKIKPEVPVVIITGYPTEESKRMSTKLGVTEYILKPFEPRELLEPIERITYRKPDIENKKIDVKSAWEDIQIKDIYRFFASSWFLQESTGMVRIGGHLTDSLNISPESVTLPETGSMVYRGLPLAEVYFGKGATQVIHSAVCGKITEVNSALSKYPSILENSINKECWIALVRPENPDKDIEAGEIRRILILSEDSSNENVYCNRYRRMGYNTLKTKSVEQAINTLGEEKAKVAIIDAATFKDQGPDHVKRICRESSSTKIIVINTPNSKFESEYRKSSIFYYGVNPVSNKELADVLSCAFRDEKHIMPLVSNEISLLPNTISKIRITNKNSTKVILIAGEDILQNDHGIGYLLTKNLLDRSYPVEVVNSWMQRSLTDTARILNIENEKENNDCIIIVHPKNTGRIPGNIIKEKTTHKNITGKGKTIITIYVQPPVNSNKIVFDNITTRSLAELIMNEMISA